MQASTGTDTFRVTTASAQISNARMSKIRASDRILLLQRECDRSKVMADPMTAYGDFRGLLLADYNEVLQNRFQKKNILQLKKETTYSGGFYHSASFDLKSQTAQA